MLVCGCSHWMHTEGIDEWFDSEKGEEWLVRSECRACGLKVGLDGPPEQVIGLVDRMMWTDDARHVLDRMPPYIAVLYKEEIEEYARKDNRRVITWDFLARARQEETVQWDPEAEKRLHNIPGPIRAMAKVELERTAAERGQNRVTVSLMEEVKARYFGMASQGNKE